MNQKPFDLEVRGKKITEDADGNILLDDIWAIAKAKPSRLPKHWRGSNLAKRLIEALQKKVTNSNLKSNSRATSVIYAKQGRGNSGTYAHPIIAAAYAGYLSPKLEIEIREVWLRYRAGDATLADEILERASAEANRWAGVRALSRSQRVTYTGVLKENGVEGRGFMHCTEAVYCNLLGGKSYQIRADRGWPQKSNLRERFDVSELSYVMAAEALSAERIQEEQSHGNKECEEASGRSARSIRLAIEGDRKDRQKKLL